MRFDRTNEMNGLASLLIATCLATAGACGKDVSLGSGKVGTAGAASPGGGGESGATAGSGSAGSAGTIGSGGGGAGGGVPVTPPPGSCLCSAVVDPVCGVDGKTYGNTCLATCRGVAVAYKGPCTDAGTDAGTDASTDGAVVCAPPGVACVFCPNGYQTGPGGCRTCACNPGGDASADTGPDAPMCRGPGVACGGCPNGYLTGPGGCPTCACKP